jgi:uncharacterized tellurite resistance protein B-like protein
MIAQHAVRKTLTESTTRTCHACMTEGHGAAAKHCLHCGAALTEYFGESPDLTPRIAFAAAMIYMINADGRIEPEEIRRLVIAVHDDRVLLEVATRYTKFNTVDQFIKDSATLLDHDQQLSILVNLYDAILANGEALPQELELFEQFMERFGFNEAEFDPYFKSIAVKNNKALFGKG